MVEAHIDVRGVALWKRATITAYCPTTGDFVVRLVPCRQRYVVKRCDLRDDANNQDILEAMARCTNSDTTQPND